ncbi:MAG: UDP-N-acetylmuramoyl-L-alanyl-D-glutamate--2,6-diaminopimelate ligase [Chloroflexi bacterium]|nr:UDP-N-acetylmuramoyl-L-alanyl-D-glutamate--2,6-diaminopimelate ligase [Chloroflexota bacterium]
MITGDTLLMALPMASAHNWRSLNIQHITSDSREVMPGDLFVAIPGVAVDGHRFIADALRAGASACVVERLVPELGGTPTLVVSNAREAYGCLQAAYYGNPSREVTLIGVTGTDGKTTTTRLLSAILRAAGKAVGSINTVSAEIGGIESPLSFHTTTPDAAEVQAYLRQIRDAGADYVVLETTSHGLAQYRVAGCDYDVAVVTNITHEHLDFHGSFEAYRDAKAMLFHALKRSVRKPGVPKIAVLNADDASYAYLAAIPADSQVVYGVKEPATVTARDIIVSVQGLQFMLVWPGGEQMVRSPLLGRYNIHNLLAAAAAALALGVSGEAIARGIASVCGVVGRMERIDQGQPFTAIIDFAHTPNALEHALRTVREFSSGQVIVVFGCAGLRDRAKRAWMGEIAGRLADKVVITAEDPRTEALDDIIAEIAAGCAKVGRVEDRDYFRVPDRTQAIARALEIARPGDLVISTGKGHERSMCFGVTEYPWSEHDAVRAGLHALGYS